jgi:hypothetical protein
MRRLLMTAATVVLCGPAAAQGAQIPPEFVGRWGRICTEERALEAHAASTLRTDVAADNCDIWSDPDKYCQPEPAAPQFDPQLCRRHMISKEEWLRTNRHLGIGDIEVEGEVKPGEIVDSWDSVTPQADGSWHVVGVLMNGGVNNSCWRDPRCRYSREGREGTLEEIWRLEQRGGRTLLIKSVVPNEFRGVSTDVWCKMAPSTEPLHGYFTPNYLDKNWHPKCLGD